MGESLSSVKGTTTEGSRSHVSSALWNNEVRIQFGSLLAYASSYNII